MATTAENIAGSFKMYSVWVAGLISLAAGYWIQLPVEQQQQILAQWPALKYYSPIFAFAAFYAARVVSQTKPDTSLLGDKTEPQVAAPVIGVASLTTPPPAPVVPDAPATVTVQLTPSEIAAILTAAEVLKKQAPQ
jgi:hypothetical protein